VKPIDWLILTLIWWLLFLALGLLIYAALFVAGL